jgi:hypothetical protein
VAFGASAGIPTPNSAQQIAENDPVALGLGKLILDALDRNQQFISAALPLMPDALRRPCTWCRAAGIGTATSCTHGFVGNDLSVGAGRV